MEKNSQVQGTADSTVSSASVFRTKSFADTPGPLDAVSTRFLQQYNFAWAIPAAGGLVVPTNTTTTLVFEPLSASGVLQNLSTLGANAPYDPATGRFLVPNAGASLAPTTPLVENGRIYWLHAECHVQFTSAGVGRAVLTLQRSDGAIYFQKIVDCGPTITDIDCVVTALPAPDDGIVNPGTVLNGYQWRLSQSTGGPVTLASNIRYNSIKFYTDHMVGQPPAPV